MSVLKEFKSEVKGPVAIGTPFRVRYRVAGTPPAGTIEVSCDDPYAASPDIPVTALEGTAEITITGPRKKATVAVFGSLGETHGFPQDVE